LRNPDFPGFLASEDETFHFNDEVFHDGKEVLQKYLNSLLNADITDSLVNSFKVSRNYRYPIIVRANVVWTIEGHNFECIEVVFKYDQTDSIGCMSKMLNE